MGRRLLVVAAVLIVVALVAGGAFALLQAGDTSVGPVPGELGTLDAGRLSGEAVSVGGVIEGVDTDNLTRTKAFQLKTADGRVLRVVMNDASRIPAPSAPRLPAELAASDDPLPFELLGYRFEGSAKVVRLGPLGLQRWYLVSSGTIQHP